MILPAFLHFDRPDDDWIRSKLHESVTSTFLVSPCLNHNSHSPLYHDIRLGKDTDIETYLPIASASSNNLQTVNTGYIIPPSSMNTTTTPMGEIRRANQIPSTTMQQIIAEPMTNENHPPHVQHALHFFTENSNRSIYPSAKVTEDFDRHRMCHASWSIFFLTPVTYSLRCTD